MQCQRPRKSNRRDFYEVSNRELEPNEKSSFKILEYAGETEEFPKTHSIVKAEEWDNTNVEEVSLEEQIEGINNITEALKNIPVEVVPTITEHENGTKQIVNGTLIYENGTIERP